MSIAYFVSIMTGLGTLAITSYGLGLIQDYQPLSGSQYELLLDALLGPPSLELKAGQVFRINIRVMSPFRPERQIEIVSSSRGSTTVIRQVLSESLQGVVNKQLMEGGSPPSPQSIHDLLRVTFDSVEIGSKDFGRWVDMMKSAICESQKEVRPGGHGRGAGLVEIRLDPTVYELIYEDGDHQFRERIVGPDPESVADSRKVSAIVSWMLSIDKEIRVLTEKRRRR